MTPLPAIAFSLAQAERRQYFVSHQRSHLERAIELFQSYLREVPNGGRRADAIDALGQLEPLAVSAAVSGGSGALAPTDRTRMVVSCEAPNAEISIDGAAGARSPVIAQVEPGTHHLRVSAPGYDLDERKVEAVPGELVPLWVTLRERPVKVALSGRLPRRPSPTRDRSSSASGAGRLTRTSWPGLEGVLLTRVSSLSRGAAEVAFSSRAGSAARCVVWPSPLPRRGCARARS